MLPESEWREDDSIAGCVAWSKDRKRSTIWTLFEKIQKVKTCDLPVESDVPQVATSDGQGPPEEES